MYRVQSIAILIFTIVSPIVGQTLTFKPAQNPSKGTITDMTFDGMDRVYLLTTQGLYWTSDEGNTWSHPDSSLKSNAITCVARVSSDIIFVGTPDSGLYESFDSGRNWKRVNIDNIAANQINALLFNPSSGLSCGTEAGFCWSGDSGKTWKIGAIGGQVFYGMIMSLSCNNEGCLLASSRTSDGLETYVYFSADSGTSWSMLYVGGVHEFHRLNSFSRAKFDVRKDTMFYVLGDDCDGLAGIWYTSLQHAPIHNYYTGENPIVFFASKDTTSYSDTYNTPLKRDFTLNQNGVVYLLYDDTISFLNSRSAWSFVGSVAASRIVIDGNGIVFCLGDSGVMISHMPTQVLANKLENPVAFQLHQNYPNPFNPSTTIRYQIPEASKVIITIINLLGQNIATLVNEQKQAGSYSLEWNASEMPSGVYFYRTEAVSASKRFVDVKKMILLK